MKKFFFFLCLSVFIYQTAATQVGIGTTTPQAFFNVAENKTVLFGLDTVNVGSKFIWYPTKSALRFGAIDPAFDLTAWHYANVGVRSLAFGLNTRATAPQSIASGVSTTASGFYAWSHGFATFAYGDHSMAIGQNTGATGNNSFALGNGSRAYGDFSQAIGNDNTSSGVFSTALGANTDARAYNCLVIGRYNDSISTSSRTGWVENDPLFLIGNGSGPARSNALFVSKGGSLGITEDPEYSNFWRGMLHVKGKNGKVVFSLESEYNTNAWSYWVDNEDDNLNLYFNTTLKGAFNDATGTYTALSDMRLKKEIMPIPSVLNAVVKLNPASYRFIDNENSDPLSYGFIAQEVQQIFPEMVTQISDRDGKKFYGLNYNNFSVLAIKAIQEQQAIITTQQKRIDDLEKRLQMIESKLK